MGHSERNLETRTFFLFHWVPVETVFVFQAQTRPGTEKPGFQLRNTYFANFTEIWDFSMLSISSALSKLGFVIEFPDPNL